MRTAGIRVRRSRSHVLGWTRQSTQVRARADLALHEVGEALADRRVVADAVVAEVVGRAARRRRGCCARRRAGRCTRSAPAALAKLARSTSSRSPSGPRVRNAELPVAREPALDAGRQVVDQHRLVRAGARRRRCRCPPWPGSMITSLPDSVGPARLIASVSRIACGCPPTTVRASWLRALSVVGPQVPSAGMPMLRWNSRSACSVSTPNRPSTRPQSKPMSSSRCCSALTSSPASSRAGM